MPTYRSGLSHYYTEKQESYVSVGAILPVFVDKYTDTTNNLADQNEEYSHPGFLYCNGEEYKIRDYPLLYEAVGDTYNTTQILNNAIQITNSLSVGSIQKMFWVNDKLFLEILNDPTTPGPDKRAYPYSCVVRFTNLGSIPAGLFNTTTAYQLIQCSEVSAQSITPNLTTTYEVFSINGALFNQVIYTINFTTSGITHPIIRVSKAYQRRDYPFIIGNFKVPDYRERKLIGYGNGVEGGGTPIVEDRTTLNVGNIGGKWQIPITRIDDPGAFFDVGDVLTTGYSDVETLVQARLTGSKLYTVGPMDDYILTRPPEHDHFLLHSRVDDTANPVVGGGMDTLTSTYTNTNGTIIDFVPTGGLGVGVPLGHAHGLLGQRLSNAYTATYGNTSGIGETVIEGGCTKYKISQAPPLSLQSATSNGSYITVVTTVPHNLTSNDWITISLAGAPWDGNYDITTIVTSTEFRAVKTPMPPSGSLPSGGIIRQADGIFQPVISTEDPRAYVIDDITVIGNKDIIVFQPGDLEKRWEVELPASGSSFSKSLSEAGSEVVQLGFTLYGAGGSGGSTSSNGNTGGNASVTFTLDSTSYTIVAYGGQGGRSGNSGGAGGQGGGFSVPTALLADNRCTITTATGSPGGNGGTAQAQGGAGGGSPGYGQGGSGVGDSFNYSNTTTYGPYYSSGNTNFPDYNNITNISIAISGGGGGSGNTNANSGCTSGVGGPGSVGRRVDATFPRPGNFNYTIGTKGGNGFNNASYGNVEGGNNNVGTGAGSGGRGGRGALGNGATGGAGGGSTGIIWNGIVILGAGGGGGGGGSGGGNNGGQWDGCYSGTGGVGPASGLYGGPAIQFANGSAGGESGCTAGGGGGGGSGCGPSGGGSGGSGGGAGAGHGGFGGGSGGAAGRSAYNSTYISAASQSGGSSSGGYAQFVVTRQYSGYGNSGGGGGQGGRVFVTITDQSGQLATGVSGSLGSPGSGGGSSGTAGYVRASVSGQKPGSNPTVGRSTAAGRSYRVPGYPATKDYNETPILTGSAIWSGATQDVEIISASAGTFPVAPSAMHDNKVTRLINWKGTGSRTLTIGPLDTRYINTLYFDIIVGQGSNGGEKPDENLLLYYKQDLDSVTKILADALVLTNVTSSVYNTYSYTIPEQSNMRGNAIFLELVQERTANQGDNNSKDTDNYGIAQMVVTYNERTDFVFTPSSSATIPGNSESGCGSDDGINEVRREITAGETNILVEDGTFTLSPSTPISVNASVEIETAIPLITKYHRVKYLIKAT